MQLEGKKIPPIKQFRNLNERIHITKLSSLHPQRPLQTISPVNQRRRGPLQRERDGFLLPPLTSAQSTVADLYGGGALRPSLPP